MNNKSWIFKISAVHCLWYPLAQFLWDIHSPVRLERTFPRRQKQPRLHGPGGQATPRESQVGWQVGPQVRNTSKSGQLKSNKSLVSPWTTSSFVCEFSCPVVTLASSSVETLKTATQCKISKEKHHGRNLTISLVGGRSYWDSSVHRAPFYGGLEFWSPPIIALGQSHLKVAKKPSSIEILTTANRTVLIETLERINVLEKALFDSLYNGSFAHEDIDI